MSKAGEGAKRSQRSSMDWSCRAAGRRQVLSPSAHACPNVWNTGTIMRRENPARSACSTMVSIASRSQARRRRRGRGRGPARSGPGGSPTA